MTSSLDRHFIFNSPPSSSHTQPQPQSHLQAIIALSPNSSPLNRSGSASSTATAMAPPPPAQDVDVGDVGLVSHQALSDGDGTIKARRIIRKKDSGGQLLQRSSPVKVVDPRELVFGSDEGDDVDLTLLGNDPFGGRATGLGVNYDGSSRGYDGGQSYDEGDDEVGVQPDDFSFVRYGFAPGDATAGFSSISTYVNVNGSGVDEELGGVWASTLEPISSGGGSYDGLLPPNTIGGEDSDGGAALEYAMDQHIHHQQCHQTSVHSSSAQSYGDTFAPPPQSSTTAIPAYFGHARVHSDNVTTVASSSPLRGSGGGTGALAAGYYYESASPYDTPRSVGSHLRVRSDDSTIRPPKSQAHRGSSPSWSHFTSPQQPPLSYSPVQDPLSSSVAAEDHSPVYSSNRYSSPVGSATTRRKSQSAVSKSSPSAGVNGSSTARPTNSYTAEIRQQMQQQLQRATSGDVNEGLVSPPLRGHTQHAPALRTWSLAGATAGSYPRQTVKAPASVQPGRQQNHSPSSSRDFSRPQTLFYQPFQAPVPVPSQLHERSPPTTSHYGSYPGPPPLSASSSISSSSLLPPDLQPSLSTDSTSTIASGSSFSVGHQHHQHHSYQRSSVANAGANRRPQRVDYRSHRSSMSSGSISDFASDLSPALGGQQGLSPRSFAGPSPILRDESTLFGQPGPEDYGLTDMLRNTRVNTLESSELALGFKVDGGAGGGGGEGGERGGEGGGDEEATSEGYIGGGGGDGSGSSSHYAHGTTTTAGLDLYTNSGYHHPLPQQYHHQRLPPPSLTTTMSHYSSRPPPSSLAAAIPRSMQQQTHRPTTSTGFNSSSTDSTSHHSPATFASHSLIAANVSPVTSSKQQQQSAMQISSQLHQHPAFAYHTPVASRSPPTQAHPSYIAPETLRRSHSQQQQQGGDGGEQEKDSFDWHDEAVGVDAILESDFRSPTPPEQHQRQQHHHAPPQQGDEELHGAALSVESEQSVAATSASSRATSKGKGKARGAPAPIVVLPTLPSSLGGGSGGPPTPPPSASSASGSKSKGKRPAPSTLPAALIESLFKTLRVPVDEALPSSGGRHKRSSESLEPDADDDGASVSGGGGREASARPAKRGRLENRYKCLVPECDRVFPRKSAIVNHIQTHLEDKPFTCSVGSWCVSSSPPSLFSDPLTSTSCFSRASFVRQHDLRRHEKIHLGTKPFPCIWFVSHCSLYLLPLLSFPPLTS